MAESPTAACHFRVVASIATDCTWHRRPTKSTCTKDWLQGVPLRRENKKDGIFFPESLKHS